MHLPSRTFWPAASGDLPVVMTDRLRIFRGNLDKVREQIESAAQRAGRAAGEIRTVAVSKYVDAEVTRDLVTAGCKTLGESRPQALWDKADQLHDLSIEWHMVGHLQRNKVRRTIPYVTMIQSVDSLRLLTTINDEARALERVIPILLEVNISGDADKHGFAPDAIEPLLETLVDFKNVTIRGLMAMAHRVGGAEVARRDFAAVRELRDRLRAAAPENVSLDELSMGMSHDFPEAIAEGATLIRVGRALFSDILA